MLLLLLRHGIAQALAEGESDGTRALTKLGVRKTRLAARGLAKIIDKPDEILTSPKLRAAQTAEILGGEFDVRPTPLAALASDNPCRILQLVFKHRATTLVLVGHEPTLGRLISHVVVGDPDAARMPLKKAGAACLELADNPHATGKLLWLMTGKMLRRMA